MLIDFIADSTGADALFVKGLLATVLVSFTCGSVGSLVVGNRMAFFSDALAHCAFAGVTLGILLTLMVSNARSSDPIFEWLVPLFMVGFGAVIGALIAFVRERTELASDTVIGVFFAGAIGFGAVLFAALRRRSNLDADQFLFGSPMFVSPSDLIYLSVLAVLTALLLLIRYNQFVFASFNPSLARSRRIPLRLHNYLFIVLLALIVNLSIRAVGVLLINGMLIVPAATASNLSRTLRQMFWLTVGLSLGLGVLGYWLSFHASFSIDRGEPLDLGPGGLIVVLNVLAFFGTMFLRRFVRGHQPV